MEKIREIIKKYETNDLEYNIMSLVLVSMGGMSIVSIIINTIINYPFIVSIKWVFLLVYSVFSLIAVLKKSRMKWIKYATLLLLCFVLIPFTWFTTGGSENVTLLYSTILLVVVSVVLRGTSKVIFVTLFIVEIEVLLLLEHFSPSMVSTVGSQTLFIDSMIQLPIIIVIISYLVSKVIRMYKKQQNMIKLYNKRLAKISLTDELSKVHNRRSILTILEENFQKAKEGKQELQILLIDIDNFKEINDQYGHQAGDNVITSMCQEIRSIIYKEGIIGRYGGDEFLIIFNDISFDQAKVYADKLQITISSDKMESINFSISGGLVNYENETDIKQLIYKADILLFEAKKMGKDMVRSTNSSKDPKQISILKKQVKNKAN